MNSLEHVICAIVVSLVALVITDLSSCVYRCHGHVVWPAVGIGIRSRYSDTEFVAKITACCGILFAFISLVTLRRT